MVWNIDTVELKVKLNGYLRMVWNINIAKLKVLWLGQMKSVGQGHKKQYLPVYKYLLMWGN